MIFDEQRDELVSSLKLPAAIEFTGDIDGFAVFGWQVNALTSNTILLRIHPGSIGQLFDTIILAQQADQALLAAHMQCAYHN